MIGRSRSRCDNRSGASARLDRLIFETEALLKQRRGLGVPRPPVSCGAAEFGLLGGSGSKPLRRHDPQTIVTVLRFLVTPETGDSLIVDIVRHPRLPCAPDFVGHVATLVEKPLLGAEI